MIVILSIALQLLGLSLIFYTVYRRRTRISVARIPGPPTKSLLYGEAVVLC